MLFSHLEDLEQVQAVVHRCEQQSGQDVLNSFFKTFTDGLKTNLISGESGQTHLSPDPGELTIGDFEQN